MNETWWVGHDQLNAEQSEVVVLPIGKSYLISGPPGSGKTNLLLLRANYLYLAGQQNIQVVVFTRTLREFIASGGSQYDFPVDKVTTSMSFFENLLYQYGVRESFPKGFEEKRGRLIEETSKLVKKKKLSNLYEAILLDEGHDHWPDEIKLFATLGRTLFVTADARQKIYPGDDSIEAIEAVVDKTVELQFHYRIGRKICRVADALMKDSQQYPSLEPSSQYNEAKDPSRVDVTRCGTLGEQAAKILESLTLHRKTYPDELLGVLCPTHPVLNELRPLLTGSALSDVLTCQGPDDVIAFGSDIRIVVSTVHAAKGLEFRTVHIAGAEELRKFPHQRQMAFTATTRAKTSLSVYHSTNLPGYYAQALQVVEAPKPLPKLAQAFGRKKK